MKSTNQTNRWLRILQLFIVATLLISLGTVESVYAVGGPDLIISKSHSSTFNQGDQGETYTITVTNNENDATSGTVTVVDTLPTGLIATAISGTGWNCILGTLTCTRSDVLNGLSSYSSITLKVNVAHNAPTQVTNQVAVSGGNDSNTSNNTDDDVTNIVQLPDLIITNVTISPPNPDPNTLFFVNVTVENRGGADTTTLVSRDLYIGNDPSLSIGGDGCPTIEPDYYRSDFNDGQPAYTNSNKSIPIQLLGPGGSTIDGLNEGKYKIWLYADGACLNNNESFENNNAYGPILFFVGDGYTFEDVPRNAFGWSHIESIAAAGITGGCSVTPLNYCPNNQVTRAQMAVFLLRGINGSSYAPPAASGTVFFDVPSNAFAAAWIEQFSATGITGGCGGGNYCPDGLVTRGQMAVFLLRAKYGSSYIPPAATGTMFSDVPSSNIFVAWIERLAVEGITGGCGVGLYCPDAPVTRAQMAIFIQRTFSLAMP